jgi:hypothetical protein
MKKIAVVYLGSVDSDVGGLDGDDRGILNHQSATKNSNERCSLTRFFLTCFYHNT